MSYDIHVDHLNRILPNVEARLAGGSSLADNLSTTERECGGLEFHPIICGKIHDLYEEDPSNRAGCPHLSDAVKKTARILGAPEPEEKPAAKAKVK